MAEYDSAGNWIPENAAQNSQRRMWNDQAQREKADRTARHQRIWRAITGTESWIRDLWAYLLGGLVLVAFLGVVFFYFVNMPACHARGGVMLDFECVHITKVPL